MSENDVKNIFNFDKKSILNANDLPYYRHLSWISWTHRRTRTLKRWEACSDDREVTYRLRLYELWLYPIEGFYPCRWREH